MTFGMINVNVYLYRILLDKVHEGYLQNRYDGTISWSALNMMTVS
jgi:hypothetical protein